MQISLKIHTTISPNPLRFMKASIHYLAYLFIISFYILKLDHSKTNNRPIYNYLPCYGNKYIFFIGKNKFDRQSHPKL